MNRILKIGMDVHSKNYTLCAMEPVIGAEDRVFANIQVTADYKNILMFLENLKQKLGMQDTYDIECGYEAGCLGYSLYNQLTAAGVKCVILAPTTMLTQQGQRIKTDARDAHMIAQCLSYGGYHPVYIPTEKDNAVKEYLRMREDHKKALKKIKQQINAFCLRQGKYYINRMLRGYLENGKEFFVHGNRGRKTGYHHLPSNLPTGHPSVSNQVL